MNISSSQLNTKQEYTVCHTIKMIIVFVALVSTVAGGESTADPTWESAKAAYAKDIESIRTKAEQDEAKAKAKLDQARQAAIKRAMAKGDLATANALQADLDVAGTAVDVSSATPAAKVDRKLLAEQRAACLEQASKEKDAGKKIDLLLMASDQLFALGDQQGYNKEIDGLLAKFGGDAYGATGAKIGLRRLEILKGSMPSADKTTEWARGFSALEKAAKPIFDQYRGAYNDGACSAADMLATLLESRGDVDGSWKYRERIIEYGGSYGDPAGKACIWLADYWLRKQAKPKAIIYLKLARDTHKGAYDNVSKDADRLLKELGQ